MTEISIVVRAFNEEKHLPALLDSIDSQNHRSYEVVLVDSGSYDRTREIAEERGVRVIRISSQDFTFGFSLNVGIEAAQGDFIAIVSAHTIPTDADWLENLIAPLRADDVAMTYGRQLGVVESKFSEAEDFDYSFGPKPREDTPRRIQANNACSAIRKSLWERKNFNPVLTGLEDADWAAHWLNDGKRVVYVPDAAIKHIHEESWSQVRRRYFREAVAARRMGGLGRRHIPREVSREARRLARDAVKCFRPGANPVAERLSIAGRLIDAVLFRANKTGGMIKGLMTLNPLETRDAQEEIFFERRNTAVVIQEPGKARLESRELPLLKPGDALIRIEHVAICATDLDILDGRLGYYRDGTADYPIVPGHEFSGRVVALGRHVDELSEGDPVVVECIQSCGSCSECLAENPIGCPDRAELGVMKRDGAYAEYVTAPARFVHPLPQNLATDRATLAEPVAVVLKGLGRLQSHLSTRKAPWNVGVLGAGPLGHICARILAHRGHRVTAYDRDEKRLALFDGTSIRTSAKLEGLDVFDVLIEITGDPDVLDVALRSSRANTALLLLGLPYGEREFSFESIAAYDKTIVGSVGSTAADFDAAIRLLPELDLSEHLKCRLPLESFEEGWRLARNGDVLKVILDAA
jgi:threonine dehydrogenase-like Zn-dependent dehydrogenase/glycosyltransferase involved in cell wall biosynthesis